MLHCGEHLPELYVSPPWGVREEILLQREDDRDDVARTYSLTLLLTWLPLWDGLDHADSFLVECGVYTLIDFYSGSRAVTLYDEADDDLTLDTCILCTLWVVEVILQILTEGIHTTGELRLLFYDFEGLIRELFSRCAWNILGAEGDVDGRKILTFIGRDEGGLFDLDVVVHDLEFLRQLDLGLLGLLLWLRLFRLILRLLFLDEERFFHFGLVASSIKVACLGNRATPLQAYEGQGECYDETQ